MEISTIEVFSKRLKCLLDIAKEEKGIDYRSVSSRLGISLGALSNYANGVQQPNITVLKNLANYFNVSADWLLGLTDARQKNPAAADELGLSPTVIDHLKYWHDTENTCCWLIPDFVQYLIDQDLDSISKASILAEQAISVAKNSGHINNESFKFDSQNKKWIVSPDFICGYLFRESECKFGDIVSNYFKYLKSCTLSHEEDKNGNNQTD